MTYSELMPIRDVMRDMVARLDALEGRTTVAAAARWKLRWSLHRNTPNARPMLQFWQPNRRTSECGGLDYSADGEWVDVPTELVDRAPDDRMSC